MPLGNAVVRMANGWGAGVVIVAAADLVVSATEVAVIVTVRLLAGVVERAL